ncbi:hypothetical protein GIB67_035492 [Kingdonia uniflora]|uniref:Uncharacterized protein n=1 Tax=Kingdonia uniflora TaxID=39325 RepID=A0A7J7P184_9MAGN|nr:hypothetical protein GIB67_035492 [Kingdonia uniflora]
MKRCDLKLKRRSCGRESAGTHVIDREVYQDRDKDYLYLSLDLKYVFSELKAIYLWLAADWPPMMQIIRLISQNHMNNKHYYGKTDFLAFKALNQHGFLGQLQERKLSAVIKLPSQTLLLSVSDKASRLIGMLFPEVRLWSN